MQSMFKKLQVIPAFSFILSKHFVILLAIGLIPYLGYSIGEDVTYVSPVIEEAWAELIEGINYKVTISDSIIFTDQLSEGHNYIVSISDGIGTTDHLS